VVILAGGVSGGWEAMILLTIMMLLLELGTVTQLASISTSTVVPAVVCRCGVSIPPLFY
jgi:hypothetical protein